MHLRARWHLASLIPSQDRCPAKASPQQVVQTTNKKGTTMTDTTYNGPIVSLEEVVRLNAAVAALKESVIDLTNERDEARLRRDQYEAQLRNVRNNLQYQLKEWAEANLDPSDESYSDLSQVMQDNGLEGLKRTYNVTVRVTYEFEVEVEASNEDEARDEVDNNITQYANDNVNPGWDSPYDMDIEVEEA